MYIQLAAGRAKGEVDEQMLAACSGCCCVSHANNGWFSFSENFFLLNLMSLVKFAASALRIIGSSFPEQGRIYILSCIINVLSSIKRILSLPPQNTRIFKAGYVDP